MSRPLELRIFTGVHAGARERLAAGECVLGSDGDCDFVITDAGIAPRHARLSAADGTWQLQWLTEPDDAPRVSLVPGSAVQMGPVIFALDEASAPWPAAEQIALLQRAQPMAAVAAVVADPPDPQPAAAGEQAAMATVAALGPTTQPRRTAAWWIAGFAAVLSAAALVAWPMTRMAHPPDAPSARSPVAPPQQRDAIDKVLASLSLTQRASVAPVGAGWEVRAAYLTEEETEGLAMALSRLNPRPGLKVTSEHELRQQVGETLARVAPGAPDTVRAQYLGDAKFRLEGRVAAPKERDLLLEALKAAFPQVRAWEVQLLVPEEVAVRLVEQLRADGYDDVAGRWDNGIFVIRAGLTPQQVPRWERALVAALARHTVPMRAEMTLHDARNPVLPAQARLPFQVRSVVGGETPYVVLADGGKLLVDGQRDGWKLAAIEAERVVFENGTKRAVIPR
jgi:type III secretion protein D